MLRPWGVAVSLALVACGKSASDGPMGALDVGGSTSAAANGGGSAGAGAFASATAGAAGARSDGAAGSGGSSAGSDAGSAGVAGLAGGSGGAGAGGLAVLPDPQAAPAPSAVVATSNSYVVFRQGGNGSSALLLLDLKAGGQPVQVNATGLKMFLPTASADGRFVVHVQSDPFPFNPTLKRAPADDVQLAVFTDAGYVAGAPVAGFDGLDYLRYPAGFDASSRFAFFVRTSVMPGIDIVDSANNRRHGSLGGPLIVGGTLNWAPKGYLFTYRADSNGSGSIAGTYLAKVIDGGVSEPRRLPDTAGQGSFSPDGRRLFYSLLPTAVGYIDLPAAPRQIYSDVASNSMLGLSVEAGGQSVLTALPDPTDATHSIVTRLFVDPTRSPQPITEPSHESAITTSESGALAALTLTGDASQRLEFLHGSERIKVAEAPFISASFSGEYLIYSLSDSDADPSSEVHAAKLVGSSVVDRRLDPGDHDFNSYCQRKVANPSHKYLYAYALPVPGIRFSDLELDGPGATRAIDATNPAATVDCPVCNTAGDACAYVEYTDASYKLFVMHYGPTGPSAATLVFESDQQLKVYATR